MFNGEYREGEVVVRIKIDFNYLNFVVRDWLVFRIIDNLNYLRIGNKYCVWLFYNFVFVIDDYEFGVIYIFCG